METRYDFISNSLSSSKSHSQLDKEGYRINLNKLPIVRSVYAYDNELIVR